MATPRAMLRARPVTLAGSARVRNQARRRVLGAAASSTNPATASIVVGCSRGYQAATRAAAIPAPRAMAMRTRRGIGASGLRFPPRHPGKTPAMPRATLSRQENAIPVFEARRGDLASRVAAALRGQHPAWVFAAVVTLGFVALAGLTIAVGQVLVGALLPPSGRSAEDHINTWLAAHRTSTLDAASAVGSAIGDAPVLPAVVVATALVLLWRRRFRVVAFIIAAAAVELATYRVASLLVHRDRPPVVRLDDLPVDQSYPSGHVAASIVVYGGVALLVSSAVRRRWVSVLCWTLAILLPVIVGLSRLYRGMHHLTDVGASVLVGVGALLVVLIAARACGVAERRERLRASVPESRVGVRT